MGIVVTACAAAGAESVQRVALSDGRMASTAQSRQTLKYLASCALDQGQVLTVDHDGQQFEFPGGLGLAPQWQSRAMTETEQRWVSACLLARTNYFGVPVMLSMRSKEPSNAPGLQEVQEEEAAYTLEEATFFGNLFSARPNGYVCSSPQTHARTLSLRAQQRICSLPDERGGTACGFIHVGDCGASSLQHGADMAQAITVFLPPKPAR